MVTWHTGSSSKIRGKKVIERKSVMCNGIPAHGPERYVVALGLCAVEIMRCSKNDALCHLKGVVIDRTALSKRTSFWRSKRQ